MFYLADFPRHNRHPRDYRRDEKFLQSRLAGEFELARELQADNLNLRARKISDAPAAVRRNLSEEKFALLVGVAQARRRLRGEK